MMKRLIAAVIALVLIFSLTACQSAVPKKDPAEVVASVEKEFMEANADKLPALMDLDGETLEAMYGIKPDWVNAYVCKFPMMNVHATEIFIASVKDGCMEDVKKAIEARKEALDATWSMYLPAQYELVQKSETLEKDGFILFAVTEQMDSIKAIFEKATK